MERIQRTIQPTQQSNQPEKPKKTKDDKTILLLLALLVGYEIYIKKFIYNSFLDNKKYYEIKKDLDEKVIPDVYKSLVINDFPNPKEYLNGISYSANKSLSCLLKRYDQKFDDLVIDKKNTFYNVLSRKFDKEQRHLVEKRLKEMLNTQFTTVPMNEKNAISLRAKAEIDVRFKQQQEMLKQAFMSGEDLYRFSAHLNCSKRCMPYQNKVCSITLKAKNMRTKYTGKKTAKGEKIYSYFDIINQVDKYGYKNNIIVGFNCRHYLIPLSKQPDPVKLDNSKVADTYKWEQIKRELEREIIRLKIRAYTLGTKTAQGQYLKALALKRTNQLKAFCAKHNLEYEPDRLRIEFFKQNYTNQQNVAFKIKSTLANKK